MYKTEDNPLLLIEFKKGAFNLQLKSICLDKIVTMCVELSLTACLLIITIIRHLQTKNKSKQTKST